jgi:carbonic anhydrase
VKAAMTNKQYGIIDNWIRHIKDVYRIYHEELEAISDPQAREDRFIELNVIEQVYDLSKTSIIQNSWHRKKLPYIHGWVYSVADGLIKDLEVSVNENSDIAEVYRFEKVLELR